MLPPVEEAVLQNNPEFATLYTTLTTVILNPDGSTKNDPAARERKAVHEELDKRRLKAAKQHLLTHTITTVDPTPSETAKPALPQPIIGTRRTKVQSQQARHNRATSSVEQLPPALLDLLVLLPPFLSPPSDSKLSASSTALLLSNPPFSILPTLLPQLAGLVSTNLHASAVHLARISNPSTNPSFVHRSIPALPNYAASLQDTIQSRQASLTKSRLATATSFTDYLSDNAVALTRLLRSLESKHGPIARSLEFRATEMALNAQKQEQEIQISLWQARRDTYSPDITRALANYMMHLRDGKGRLKEGMRNLKSELAEYGVDVDAQGDPDDEDSAGGGGVRRSTRAREQERTRGKERDRGKERTMREMARVYREMGRQMEEVRGDLERLGRA
ncbi:hypothetical protein V8F06_009088 [Rhypophila decipiens]